MTEQLRLDRLQVQLMAQDQPKTLLDDFSLTLAKGDFVTVLGTNGAGKSTLFNAIAGNLSVSQGTIALGGQQITHWSAEKRARLIARVFQDPKMGTAPRMSVAENLALAEHRGQALRLKPRRLRQRRAQYTALLAETGNGLASALDRPTGNLSGGQRQALSLLMATITTPELLLLDEHTAALDPKTSQAMMALTAKIITGQQLTCLMITHRLEDALNFGNRLIILNGGHLVADYAQEQKSRLSKADLLPYFQTY